MNVSPKQIGIVASSGITALLAGTLIASGMKNNVGQTITLATLLTLPTAVGIHLVIDSQATKRINEAQEKAKRAESSASQAKSEAVETFENWQATRIQLEQVEVRNSQLLAELAAIRQTLEQVEGDRAKFASMVANLQPTISKLESDLTASREQVEELQAEIEAWEQTFDERVNLEATERFKEARANEIQRIFDEHDTITNEAMMLFKRLQAWALKVSDGHESKRQIITSLATSYNSNLDQLNELVDKEREGYLRQIEILNMRVGQLQKQLSGDLVEPEYLACGFDPNGRIANAIAEWLWNHHKIPLKVTGFEVASDGTLTTGFTYPRSMPLEALFRQIEGDSSTIARSLGLYSVEKPQKLQIADVLTVKIRRERPARKADKGSLYRSKEEFVKFLLSQPVRLRIVGEPGSGKTPTVAVLLGHILSRGFLEANTPNGRKLPYCVVESCNPLAGISVKNGAELDFCLKWDSGSRGFKGLAQEYQFRKNPTNAEYKSQVGYIWVADEIDVTMADLTKDEAKPFKDALKDGGHINLGVIVMGQSANVSTSKGLSIDDQKMLTNIYIDAVSIRTFLTQYGERFYSKRAVEKALATLEELELEIEEKNEVICDTAREFRIAMITANRSPVFYQLPYFDSVEIDVESYQETLEKVALLLAPRQQHVATTDKLEAMSDIESASIVAGAGATPTQVDCPKCASTVKRNGKTSTGVQKYLCKNADCKHGFTD